MEKKISYGRVLTFSGAIIAYLIGSGFATGQEALQFYISFGFKQAIGGFLISLILLSWVAATILDDGRVLKLVQPSEIFFYYCGKHLGRLYEIFTIIVLYMLFVVMISGSGAVMHEYYGIEHYVGCLVMALISLVTVLLGLEKIVNIIGRMGPLIVFVAITLGLVNVINNYEHLSQADNVMRGLKIARASTNWLRSAILYVSLCTIVMVPFLAGMGAGAESKKEAWLSGILGGTFFTLGAMAVGFGMLASIGRVYNLQAPALALADFVYPGFGIVYSTIIVLGIYTTSVPMLWAPCKRINADEKSMAFKLAAVLGTIVAYFGGKLHFSTLVNIIYPFCGYLGAVLLVCIVAKKVTEKVKGKSMQG